MATTARANLRAGMVNIAGFFSSANPTLCRRVFSVRPTRETADLPYCYIDILTESEFSSSGVLARTIPASFVFVLRPIVNEDEVLVLDAIVDGFLEHLKDWANAGDSTPIVWSRGSVSEEGETLPDGTVYPIIRFTLLDALDMTGRT
jgi:hypothetical protein